MICKNFIYVAICAAAAVQAMAVEPKEQAAITVELKGQAAMAAELKGQAAMAVELKGQAAAVQAMAVEPKEQAAIADEPKGQAAAVPGQAAEPMVNDDGAVTFVYENPTAGEVTVKFAPPLDKYDLPMMRTGNIWTATTRPLESEYYTYRFVIDGDSAVVDPANSCRTRDIGDMLSYFVVGGGIADDYVDRDVAHGCVEKVWYPSAIKGMERRRMSVYLPAAYDADSLRRFPVLYLLHGSGGDEDAWIDLGRAPQILDNMIATGRCEPMIVVMPNGNVDVAATPGADPQNPDVKPTGNNETSMLGGFERTFMDEIVGYVDDHFRTAADKAHRAVAGLSMGGFHAKYIAQNYPDAFDYIGLFSALPTPVISPEKDGDNPRYSWENYYIYEDEDAKLAGLFAGEPRLYYIAVGRDDFLREMNDTLRATLTERGYPFVYNESAGGHSWDNWRKYLVDLLPRLFRD